jgi:acetyl-CoA carboxylase biotin carboxyl carrier protein
MHAQDCCRGHVATSVRAHIAGTIWKVGVTPDDEVADGATLIVIESMKMEIPVEAPVRGRVTAIHVKPGQVVEEGDPLLDLEAI